MKGLPRLLTRPQAAAYCSYSPGQFSRLVVAGRLPASLPGMARWDRKALDLAIDALSGIEAPLTADEELDAWKREYDARKAMWPKHNLNKRLETALRFLGRHPGPQPVSIIAGVSDRTMEELIEKWLAAEVTGGDERTFVLTAQGEDEFERYKARDAQR